MAAPLIVDGSRPAVAWVASLPGSWTTDRERLVLLVLACDAFEGTSAPSGAVLASWCGLINGRLYEALASLVRHTEHRPALIERVDSHGEPVPPGKRGGRERTRYRLRTELSTSAGTVEPELSAPVGTVGTLRTDRESSEAQWGQLSRATLPGNSPGQLSRSTLPVNSPGQAGDALPLPTQPSPQDSRSSAARLTTPVVLAAVIDGHEPDEPGGPDPNDERNRQLAALERRIAEEAQP